jgi:hypothetical protein
MVRHWRVCRQSLGRRADGYAGCGFRCRSRIVKGAQFSPLDILVWRTRFCGAFRLQASVQSLPALKAASWSRASVIKKNASGRVSQPGTRSKTGKTAVHFYERKKLETKKKTQNVKRGGLSPYRGGALAVRGFGGARCRGRRWWCGDGGGFAAGDGGDGAPPSKDFRGALTRRRRRTPRRGVPTLGFRGALTRRWRGGGGGWWRLGGRGRRCRC